MVDGYGGLGNAVRHKNGVYCTLWRKKMEMNFDLYANSFCFISLCALRSALCLCVGSMISDYWNAECAIMKTNFKWLQAHVSVAVCGTNRWINWFRKTENAHNSTIAFDFLRAKGTITLIGTSGLACTEHRTACADCQATVQLIFSFSELHLAVDNQRKQTRDCMDDP